MWKFNQFIILKLISNFSGTCHYLLGKIIMKKHFIILFLLGFISISAQFKGDENKPIDIREGILSDNPVGSLFSFVDPNKFNMNHSFQMSYSAFGNDGMALGVYTNKLSYEFNDQLNIQVNTSFVNSPYNTMGERFTNSINGVYIDRARINYNPSENFNVSLQFSNSPYNNYSRHYYRRGYYSRGFSPLSSFWDD